MKRNIAALAAAFAVFFAVGEHFRRAVIPFPETPFALAGGAAAFFAVRTLAALVDLIRAARRERVF